MGERLYFDKLMTILWHHSCLNSVLSSIFGRTLLRFMKRFLLQVFHFKALVLKWLLYAYNLTYKFIGKMGQNTILQPRLIPIKIPVKRGFTIFFMMLSFHVFAQTSTNHFTSTAASYQVDKLTNEEKAELIQQMVNSSREIEIPTEMEKSFKDFFANKEFGPKLYLKFRTLYVVLFNENISKVNRLLMCNFLLDNMSSSEFPIDRVLDIKQTLLNSSK